MGTLKQVNRTEELDSRGLHSKSLPSSPLIFHSVSSIMMDSTKIIGVQVILIAAYSLIILLGLVGNSLVIYMIVKYKNMRTVTNFFIANLAVADLMVDSLCLPFTLVYTLTDEWKFGPVLCHLIPYAQAMSVSVSTITLMVIALDRYWCIIFHLSSRISKNLSFIIISITWIAAAILAIPMAIFREYRYEDFLAIKLKIAVCSEKWADKRDATMYSLSMLILQYALPLSVICYAYVRIWFKLKNHVSPTPRSENQQRRKNTTKMLVMMVVVFAVCWLPFHIYQLAFDLEWTLTVHENNLLYTIFHVIAMCSTFVNPFLYGWMNKNYRHGFLTFFGCKDTLQSTQPDGSVRGHSYTFRATTLHGSIRNGGENGHPPTQV